MLLGDYIQRCDGHGKVVYIHEPYIVKESDKKGYIIYNNRGKFEECHGHIDRLKVCIDLIRLINRNIVPDSSYLRGTCLRICLDKKYLDKVQNKIDKDNNKTGYINVNKGVRLR